MHKYTPQAIRNITYTDLHQALILPHWVKVVNEQLSVVRPLTLPLSLSFYALVLDRVYRERRVDIIYSASLGL